MNGSTPLLLLLKDLPGVLHLISFSLSILCVYSRLSQSSILLLLLEVVSYTVSQQASKVLGNGVTHTPIHWGSVIHSPSVCVEGDLT